MGVNVAKSLNVCNHAVHQVYTCNFYILQFILGAVNIPSKACSC